MSAIIFEQKSPWMTLRQGNSAIYRAGHIASSDMLFYAVSAGNIEEIKRLLLREKLQFGIMIETDEYIFAATDRTLSFPIFYHTHTGNVSNHAQLLDADLKQNTDSENVLCFASAGYTLGNQTLHKNIAIFESGGFCFFEKNNPIPPQRYYRYAPNPVPQTREEAKEKLGHIFDRAIQDCITIADGAPIWVPISGGYDSRLILAKLHEHKYDNLHCFSYGKTNNDEAKIALQVTEKLGMKRHMIAAHSQTAYDLYHSSTQKEYEEFCHGYYRIPSYVEFESIYSLKKSGLTTEDSFIINGQSGDFISGDHIPAALYENKNPTLQTLLDFAIQKHFSMWIPLKTPENREILEKMILNVLLPDDPELSEKENLIRRYESFEWQERQSKMVVNSAHVYDYFGYRWALPLWHSDVMDFFETLPFDMKYGRNLFLEYFKDYNYKGVFDIPRAQVKTWQPHQYWIILAAKMIELTRGNDAKADFYKKMSYFGHAGNQYALFDHATYLKHYKDIRNMISLTIYDFLLNHDLDLPKPMVKR